MLPVLCSRGQLDELRHKGGRQGLIQGQPGQKCPQQLPVTFVSDQAQLSCVQWLGMPAAKRVQVLTGDVSADRMMLR